MRLRAGLAQPITKIAVRILVKIDDVGTAAIDREIARAARSDISVTSGGPTKQVLRTEIAALPAEPRTKTDDFVHFMLSRTLRVKVAPADRPGELKRHRGIKRNDSVIRPTVADGAVCEHRRWRVQTHCAPVRTRRLNVCRQSTAGQARVREIVVSGLCIRSQSIDKRAPWNRVDRDAK